MLLRVEGESARHWYMNEAATQNWTTRALERQIGTWPNKRMIGSMF
jgi:predicted nuclease of restriction endonuclease-like (RecB) superfamily